MFIPTFCSILKFSRELHMGKCCPLPGDQCLTFYWSFPHLLLVLLKLKSLVHRPILLWVDLVPLPPSKTFYSLQILPDNYNNPLLGGTKQQQANIHICCSACWRRVWSKSCQNSRVRKCSKWRPKCKKSVLAQTNISFKNQ